MNDSELGSKVYLLEAIIRTESTDDFERAVEDFGEGYSVVDRLNENTYIVEGDRPEKYGDHEWPENDKFRVEISDDAEDIEAHFFDE